MKKYNALGYHIYAGGFTVGVSRHFNILAHLEHSNYGVATCQLNFPKLSIYTKESDWPKRFKEPIDLLYGNPPCAAFSVIGKHKGVDDPRLYYHERFQQLIKEHQPQVAVVESVRGLLKKGTELVESFCTIPGYAFYIVEHDAQYLNVPQERKRVFLVASKVKLDWFSQELTEPMPSLECLKQVKNPKQQCFASQQRLYSWMFKHTKPGEHLVEVFNRLIPKSKRKTNNLGVIGRPSFASYRLHPDKVSGAMIGIFRVHPIKNQVITMEEAKALSSYPLEYQIKDINELSRAVMPNVGDWLARVVKHGLRRGAVPTKLIEHVNVKPS